MLPFILFCFIVASDPIGVNCFSVFSSRPYLWTKPSYRNVESNQDSRMVLASNKQNDDSKSSDPLTKASWYVVEAFGNAFGGTGNNKPTLILETDQPPKSIAETKERLRMDNERSYFFVGNRR